MPGALQEISASISASDLALIADINASDKQPVAAEGPDHRGLLGHELSHRVKNAPATVHAIAAQASKTAATSEAFVVSFSGRIMAMARAHDLLAGGGWQGASLREILESELTPHRTDATSLSLMPGFAREGARQRAR